MHNFYYLVLDLLDFWEKINSGAKLKFDQIVCMF
jgi:hypothetical protein